MQVVDASKYGLVVGAISRNDIIIFVLGYLGERALSIAENQLQQLTDYMFNNQTPFTTQNLDRACTQFNIVPQAADNDG
jgi:hypothetical protein